MTFLLGVLIYIFGVVSGLTAFLVGVYYAVKKEMKNGKSLSPAEKQKSELDEMVGRLLKQNMDLQEHQGILISQLKYYDNLTPATTVAANKQHNTQIYDHWMALEEKRVMILEQILHLDSTVLLAVENTKTKAIEQVPLATYLNKVKATLARYRNEDAAAVSTGASSTNSNKTYLC